MGNRHFLLELHSIVELAATLITDQAVDDLELWVIVMETYGKLSLRDIDRYLSRPALLDLEQEPPLGQLNLHQQHLDEEYVRQSTQRNDQLNFSYHVLKHSAF